MSLRGCCDENGRVGLKSWSVWLLYLTSATRKLNQDKPRVLYGYRFRLVKVLKSCCHAR